MTTLQVGLVAHKKFSTYHSQLLLYITLHLNNSVDRLVYWSGSDPEAGAVGAPSPHSQYTIFGPKYALVVVAYVPFEALDFTQEPDPGPLRTGALGQWLAPLPFTPEFGVRFLVSAV